jgi:hypothetical protein
MAGNKNRDTLYNNLVRGVYALGGIDGEFIASLCRHVPFKPVAADWPTAGLLAPIPANRVAAVVSEIQGIEDEILAARDGAQDHWDDDVLVGASFDVVQIWLKALDQKEEQLADLLAA